MFLCVRRVSSFALKPVEKECGGEQVGGSPGRYVQLDEVAVAGARQHAEALEQCELHSMLLDKVGVFPARFRPAR